MHQNLRELLIHFVGHIKKNVQKRLNIAAEQI